METGAVRPCGGYMPEEVAVEVANKIPPHPAQWMSMDPGTFVKVLQTHLHSRWDGVGVECNRWGARQRHNVGLQEHGTIWFSSPQGREMSLSLPCNSIPYTTVKTARWNEEAAQFTDGEIVRGWRPSLVMLLKNGHLMPHKELSLLIGEDSFKLSPRHFWL